VDRFRYSHSERQILFVTIHLRSFTLRAALVSVGQAFLLGSVQSHFLDQYALSFVAFASPAKANHHGGKSAVPSGPSGKSGVPSGQVNQMIEIGTGEQSCRWPSLKRKSPPTSCFPESAHFDSARGRTRPGPSLLAFADWLNLISCHIRHFPNRFGRGDYQQLRCREKNRRGYKSELYIRLLSDRGIQPGRSSV